jgi:hypothetical protein
MKARIYYLIMNNNNNVEKKAEIPPIAIRRFVRTFLFCLVLSNLTTFKVSVIALFCALTSLYCSLQLFNSTLVVRNTFTCDLVKQNVLSF